MYLSGISKRYIIYRLLNAIAIVFSIIGRVSIIITLDH